MQLRKKFKFTFDDAPDGFSVLDLTVDDETRLFARCRGDAAQDAVVTGHVEGVRVRNAAVAHVHVNGVKVTRSAHLQQCLHRPQQTTKSLKH